MTLRRILFKREPELARPKHSTPSRFSRIAWEWLVSGAPFIIDIRNSWVPVLLRSPFCYSGTNEMNEINAGRKEETTIAWHALISSQCLIAVARGARNSERRKNGKEKVEKNGGKGDNRGGGLHRQQQVSARATTVISMSRIGCYDRSRPIKMA